MARAPRPRDLKKLPHKKAGFVEPMECLPVSKLPEGASWLFEIKLDGYRVLAVKSGKRLTLFSRRKNPMQAKFPYIAKALADLPEGTTLDGELVALDEHGRPNFQRMQSFRSEEANIYFFAFDVLCLKNRSLMQVPLVERKALLRSVLKSSSPHIRISEHVVASASQMLKAVRTQRLEGIIGKREDSVYEAGRRSGAWIKYRLNQEQEFVVGGYVPGPLGFDSLIVGYYRGNQLIYVARLRNGFVPETRKELFPRLQPLAVARGKCPFANLPETERTRWGQGLTADKMKQCVWLRPELVVRVAFLEWTGADHLRHSRFVGMQEDKDPRKVIKETT